VFERFTEPARQVVVRAAEEARALRHNYIGTEHILLGLLREEQGIAARVLESLDVNLEGVRAQVVRIIGTGDESVAGQIPFTPRAKEVLELSLREALALGHQYIGTEHVLLGVVTEGEGVACRILANFDITPSVVREAVARALSGTGARVQLHGPAAMEMPPLGRFKQPPRFKLNSAVLLGWTLFAVALGVGIAIGWAIWG
jgi:ATP-dependent Clp protease ATP-binding subunit ClpC